MPKKAKLGTHPKAVEARERKASQKIEEEARRQKEVEDEYWRDENKALKRKEDRKVSANPLHLQAPSLSRTQGVFHIVSTLCSACLLCNLVNM